MLSYLLAEDTVRSVQSHRAMMSRLAVSSLLSTMFLSYGLSESADGGQRVELEVVISGNNALAAHEWAQLLTKLPFDSVRVSSRSGVGTPAIEASESGNTRYYRVTGVVTGSDILLLPGGKFRQGEGGRIRDWLANIGKVSGLDPELHAFGLTAEQLVDIADQLAVPQAASTRDRSAKEVLREISRRLKPRIAIHESARNKIGPGTKVGDELKGLSAGTSLAAILRPLGLVLVPEHRAGQTRLLIKDVRSAEESWPIGWPRTGDPGKLVPKWFEYLEVDIHDVSLAEALTVLQSRLKIPFLMDHNGMARQDIDPSRVAVSFPSKRTFYGRIIRGLLAQARLRGELRADEAGEPFLWISPPGRG